MSNNGSNGSSAGGHGKLHSIALTEGPSRAAARAMLHAVGFTRNDLGKPIIGIANTWTEIGPCNFHLRSLAVAVKLAVHPWNSIPSRFQMASRWVRRA